MKLKAKLNFIFLTILFWPNIIKSSDIHLKFLIESEVLSYLAAYHCSDTENYYSEDGQLFLDKVKKSLTGINCEDLSGFTLPMNIDTITNLGDFKFEKQDTFFFVKIKEWSICSKSGRSYKLKLSRS